ncbi:MAG: pyridoxamine 5'-phosphate oxidase family protein [Rhodospirillales bacterium]|nr:pyridoxamine 5'-phosphate oxidase family protein [Rhodospirillales bacterium]
MPRVANDTPAHPPSGTPSSPFHQGEQAMQALAGVRERMDQRAGRAIRDFMPEQHRAFFAGLPMLPLAAGSEDGWPVATILTGAPGFAASPDPRTLRIAVPPDLAAPPGTRLVPGASVGLLGIAFETRRRNRLNGRVNRIDAAGFDVAVVQSFGNCAQYIQARHMEAQGTDAAPPPGAAGPTEELAGLDTAARRLIAGADTLFVASSDRPSPDAALDLSHRGGRPGFLRLEGDVLSVPDFAGNRYFNTLGNFRCNPRAAVLLPDFATGALLHLAGPVELVHAGADLAAIRGAERLWRVRISRAWRRPNGLPRAWSPPEPAPSTSATGIWIETPASLDAHGDRTA